MLAPGPPEACSCLTKGEAGNPDGALQSLAQPLSAVKTELAEDMQGWPQEALGKSRHSLSRGGKELWVVRRGPRKERRLRCCPSWGTAPDLPRDTREPLAFL